MDEYLDDYTESFDMSESEFSDILENSDIDTLMNLRDRVIDRDITVSSDYSEWDDSSDDDDQKILTLGDRMSGLSLHKEFDESMEGFSETEDIPVTLEEPTDVDELMDDIDDSVFETVDESSDVDELMEGIDYDAIYEGLDTYDFGDVNYEADLERLDSSLAEFQSENWEGLTLDEKEAAMNDLAEYVEDVIGFDNPPSIEYYSSDSPGEYGGYYPDTNTLRINENMLFQNEEAADTVAHELWHAYQHECALNPQCARDYQYQYGFDNYISPDMDFEGYQDQLVEAEARAFAEQFKGRLSTISGRGY